MKQLATFSLLLLLLSSAAHSAVLAYTIDGVEGEVRENIEAWLGPAPQTEQERRGFVALSRSRVSGALEALGFYSPFITVAVERSEPTWNVNITVDPGDPVRVSAIDIIVEGEAGEDKSFEQLLDNPGLQIGEPLHHGRYDTLRKKLMSLTQSRGYFDANIALSRVEVDAAARTAHVRIALHSGVRYRFGELIYDDTLIDAALLKALQPFEAGDPYLQSQLGLFQARIQQTRFFSTVLIQPLRDEVSAGHVPIAINMQNAARHTIDVGVGYSTDTEERLSLTWRTPRVNRFGHSQQTRLQYSSVNPSGRVDYNIPLTHPLNDFLQLSIRTEENEFGDIDSQQDELSARREQRSGEIVWGYSMRQLTESWELLGVSRTNDYLLPGVSLSSRHHSGSPVDPNSGFSQLYTAEVANSNLGSDVELLRLTSLLRFVYKPFAGHRLVGRTELGLADISSGDRAQLAPSLNFFAGGNQSIRGFGYQSIGNEVSVTRTNGSQKNLVVGGDRLLVLSAEYQYYFTDQWRGALFTDGGDAFDDGEFDWNYGAGFGIHYLSPVGAVRVEIANSLSDDNPDWRLHLNIGAEF